jgi:hypothetical protein
MRIWLGILVLGLLLVGVVEGYDGHIKPAKIYGGNSTVKSEAVSEKKGLEADSNLKNEFLFLIAVNAILALASLFALIFFWKRYGE